MPKERDPRRDRAADIYRDRNGEVTMGELSAILATEFPDDPPLSEGTLRGWKAKDKQAWSLLQAVESGMEQRSERSNHGTERSEPAPSPPPLEQSVEDEISEALAENQNLTEKQRAFCLEYIRDFNARQAAIRAGYSPRTAGQIGYQLLHKTTIMAEVERLKKIKGKSIMVAANDVLELHTRIAFADMNNFVTYRNIQRPILHNGKPIPMTDADGNTVVDPATGRPVYLSYNTNDIRFHPSEQTDGQLIQEISQGRDGARIKLRNADRSLQFLENFLGLNQDKGDGKSDLAHAWIKALMGGDDDAGDNEDE